MNSKLIFLTFFYFICTTIWSQNLVSNPSFEDITLPAKCDWYITDDQLDTMIVGWSNPNRATPDIHSTYVDSTCWSSAYPNYYDGSICRKGEQKPRSGNVMGGYIPLSSNPGWKEYLQNSLIDSMIIGQLYMVTFYISLADESKWGTNNFGVYFSENYTKVDYDKYLKVVPQINFTEVVTEDKLWVKMQTLITADANWRYMTIGNFFSDSETTFIERDENCSNAYYYIDDVSVIPIIISQNID